MSISLEKQSPSGKKVYKILIAGDGGIGKTTLLKILCYNQYFGSQKITIGNEIFLKKGKIKGKDVFFQIWDLSGQERFRFLLDGFIKGAVGAILGFDVRRRQSFINLKKWLGMLRDQNSEMPIILIGTKKDIGYHPTLRPEMAKEFIKQHDLKGFVEVSSKDNLNVELPFRLLVKEIIPCDPEEIEFILLSV